MPERKGFLLRVPPELLEELSRWARDELRSLNAQIEFALREALRQRGRGRLGPRADGAETAGDVILPTGGPPGAGPTRVVKGWPEPVPEHWLDERPWLERDREARIIAEEYRQSFLTGREAAGEPPRPAEPSADGAEAAEKAEGEGPASEKGQGIEGSGE